MDLQQVKKDMDPASRILFRVLALGFRVWGLGL